MNEARAGRRDWPATIAALVLLGFGVVPLAAWVGSPAQQAEAWRLLRAWPSGLGITLLATALLFMLIRRRSVPTALLSLPSARVEQGLLAVSLVLPVLVALFVFDARPLLIDEAVQQLQARTYASGRLAEPLPPDPQFSSTLLEAEHAGQRFSQFPPGWPLFLMPFVSLGAAWLAGPVVALLTALIFRALLRELEPDAGTRTLALAVYVLAPFVWFMAGSQMNHGLAALGVMLGLLGTLRVLRGGNWLMGLASGGGFGIAVLARPLDGATFALPCALVLLAALRHRDRRASIAVAALSGAACLLLFGWINYRTTGDPALFAYQYLWGSSVGLGFHDAPWGPPHTPQRGLAFVSLYLLRLQERFLESPMPALLPAIAALLLARRTSVGDRLLLAGSACLLTGYFAYWHDGEYLGPRFVVLLGPVVALWTARLPSLVREWSVRGAELQRGVYCLFAVAALGTAVFGVRVRWLQYQGGFTSLRWPLQEWAADAGVRNSVVFVRESWGAQLVARLWGLGVNRTQTEQLYRGVDACRLEHAITAMEASADVRGARAFEQLRPLMADSARLRGSPVSPDTTERWLPGSPYDARCLARVAADTSGSLFYLPFRLVNDGNLYVRDLAEQNDAMRARHADRPAWLAVRPDRSIDAGVRFIPLKP